MAAMFVRFVLCLCFILGLRMCVAAADGAILARGGVGDVIGSGENDVGLKIVREQFDLYKCIVFLGERILSV